MFYILLTYSDPKDMLVLAKFIATASVTIESITTTNTTTVAVIDERFMLFIALRLYYL